VFRLNSLLLTITLIAFCLALSRLPRDAKPFYVLFVVFAVPAYFRTVLRVMELQQLGYTVTVPFKIMKSLIAFFLKPRYRPMVLRVVHLQKYGFTTTAFFKILCFVRSLIELVATFAVLVITFFVTFRTCRTVAEAYQELGWSSGNEPIVVGYWFGIVIGSIVSIVAAFFFLNFLWSKPDYKQQSVERSGGASRVGN
jgi:hypothetical protein